MTRLAAALLTLLFCGCGGGGYRVEIAMADAADLVVLDERADAPDRQEGPGWAALPLIPLLPYVTRTQTHFLERSLAPELAERLRNSNVFRAVHTQDDPHAARAKAGWQLEVTLLSLEDRRCVTAWLLGPAGAVLWFAGLPHEMVATDAALRVTWRSRERGAEAFETQGQAEMITPYVIYADSSGSAVDRAGRALGRALDVALRRGLRHLRGLESR
jgi:hypothetical protein